MGIFASGPHNFLCAGGRERITHGTALVLLLLSVFWVPLGSCNKDDEIPAAYREYAYVTNGRSDSVTVIDVLTLRAIKTIPVGRGPTGVAINPQKNEIYAVNSQSDNVSFIDAERNQVIATVGVHRTPYFISVSADGKRGYVANSGSANVSVLDLDARKVAGTIHVGGSPGLAQVSPDGKSVVVANRA